MTPQNKSPDTNEQVVEHIAKRRGNGANSPVIGNNGYDIQGEEGKSFVGRILRETLEAYRMPKVRSDDELLNRLDDYFERCASRDIKPTVEEMCVYTGYTIQGIWDIENGRSGGFSAKTSEIIKKAKNYMSIFDARLLIEGKLNPVSYIFRAKNYYGMKDVQDVVLTPNNPLGSDADPATITERYKQALPPPTID